MRVGGVGGFAEKAQRGLDVGCHSGPKEVGKWAPRLH